MTSLDQKIIFLKTQGKTRAEIAKILGISKRKVKDRLYKIYKNIGGYDNFISTVTNETTCELLDELKSSVEDLDINSIEEELKLYKQEQISENINFIDLSYVNHDEVLIIPLGDVHWGSPHCDRQKFLSLIQWAKQQENVFFLLMGDLIECAVKDSPGDGIYKQITDPMTQFKQISKILYLIKDKIIGVHIGNHEYRIMKNTSINISELLSMFLNATYLGYSSLTTIKFGEQYYDLASTHGAGGSKLPHTKLKKVLDFAQIYFADIYCMGHVHEKVNIPTLIRYREGGDIKIKKRHFVLTGHFLEWKDSYAEMQMLLPSNLGMPIIKLSRDYFNIKILT